MLISHWPLIREISTKFSIIVQIDVPIRRAQLVTFLLFAFLLVFFHGLINVQFCSFTVVVLVNKITANLVLSALFLNTPVPK